VELTVAPADDRPPTPADLTAADREAVGPVPPDNQPGHRPPVDQDEPVGPPPRPRSAIPRTTTFPFRFDPVMRLAALPFGVVPGRTGVTVGEHDLTIRFGSWSLRTPLVNVEDVQVTGPYTWFKVVGPPRLSLADGGITFATSTSQGVCIRFREPVPAVLPVGLVRHPGATVTVAEPDALARELRAAVRRAEHAARSE
jgi:hypothetical protein